jgi:hypothetical protein
MPTIYRNKGFLRQTSISCQKIGENLWKRYFWKERNTGAPEMQKRQFFRLIFRRKYFKNHNIGPRFDWVQFT